MNETGGRLVRQRIGRNHEFLVNDQGEVVVYIDGACINNGRDGAKAGIGVWWDEDHKLNKSRPVKGARHTNNVAEIQAATKALRVARNKGIRRLVMMTDSQFLMNCIGKWASVWRKNGWRTNDGKPVINKPEIEEYLNVQSRCGVEVRMMYVPGHKGNRGNEEADRLAKEGAQFDIYNTDNDTDEDFRY